MTFTQIDPPRATRHPARTRAISCAPALLALALPMAQAQLVDGGFESNPLTTIAAVINTPFPMMFGMWGPESATIVGTVGLVVPQAGLSMLSTTFTGGVTSQTVQAIDVTSLGSTITAGANFTLSAYFNALDSGPIGGIAMQFFSSNTYATQIGVPVFREAGSGLASCLFTVNRSFLCETRLSSAQESKPDPGL